MKAAKILPWVGLALLALGFIVVFARVLDMRFASGDMYPHYASFRSDPLGTSALYQSLSRMEDLRTEQNLKALTAIQGLDGESALLLLGLPWDEFEDLRAKDDSPVLQAVKEEGARLIITLNPKQVPLQFRSKKTDEEESWFERRRKLREKLARERSGKTDPESETKDDKEKEEKESEEEKDFEISMSDALGSRLEDRLGITVARQAGEFMRPDEGWLVKAGKGVPSALPMWYSQFRLSPGHKSWKNSVTLDKKPVVAERKFGKGSVVIATDSYFTSNESLHAGGDPQFLIWLLGGKTHIVFDETIHGSLETGGAMKLIRRYRLHGFFFGLFLFIGLWAWRSATSLAPGDESVERGLIGGSSVAGEQSGKGFVNLLKRSIPTKELLPRCVETLRKGRRSSSKEQDQKVDALLHAHTQDPKSVSIVETYRAISQALRKR